MRKFLNRTQAGILLGEQLLEMPLQNPLVLGLPRGGVPVAYEIARALGAPLDVLIVRKVGAPNHRELGIGAITENGHFWIDFKAARHVHADALDIERILEEEKKEVQRRMEKYRGNRPLPPLEGRTVIVADDGLATGATARVACAYLKHCGAAKVILAVPVASPDAAAIVRSEVDELVCLSEPDFFLSVGQFYEEFEQLEDEEVLLLLSPPGADRLPPTSAARVTITDDQVHLNGTLSIPNGARGLVIFAHGAGSSRLSPRNQRVAASLNRAGFATLLFDLLAPREARIRKNIFDIPLLGERLLLATRWARRRGDLAGLPVAYFGASTGAAAALWAAAEPGCRISAVVSRGGRPDLAGESLKQVTAPTLLLVGSHDGVVIEMNRAALRQLPNAKLSIIPGAGHLFEEPGTLELVEKEALEWFKKNLRGSKDAAA